MQHGDRREAANLPSTASVATAALLTTTHYLLLAANLPATASVATAALV